MPLRLIFYSLLLLVTTITLVFITACESPNKSGEPSVETDEVTRLLNLAEDIELNIAGDSCIQYYEAALDAALRESRTKEQLKIHVRLGLNYLGFQEYENAKTHLRKSLELAEMHHEHHEEIAFALDSYGFYHETIKNYDSSLYYFNRGLDYGIRNLKPGHESISNSYLSIAWHYGNIRKHYDKAIENLKESLAIRVKLFGENSGEAGECYLNIAKWYNEQADFYKAIEYMEKASRIMEEILPADGLAVLKPKLYLGNYYRSVSENQKAILILKEIIQSPENRENSLILAEADLSLASCYTDNEPEKAEILFKKAIDKYQILFTDSSENFVKVYHELGNFYNKQGAYELSHQYLKRCEKIVENIYGKDSFDYGNINISLTELFINERKWDKAIQAAQKALASLETEASDRVKREAITANKLLGQIYTNYNPDLKNLKKALKYYSKAIEAIEKLKRDYSNDLAKEELTKEISSIFDVSFETAYKIFTLTGNESYKENAFLIAEKSRSYILLSEIIDSKAKEFAGIPDELLKRESELRNDIAFYQGQIYETISSNESDQSKINALKDKLFNSTIQLDKLNQELNENFPRFKLISNQITYPNINLIQSSLSDEEAVLEYFLGKKSVFILVILKGKFDIIQVSISANFREKIRQLSLSVNKYENAKFIGYAQDLYRQIVAPAIEILPKNIKKINIIPDGELSIISFDYLIINDQKIASMEAANYLIEKYIIGYHYSASLVYSINRSKPFRKSILISAPIFDGDRNFTPQLSPLKMSEMEARSIAELANKNEYQTLLLMREDASEESFKNNANGKGIIHLATHTEINKNNNNYSTLYFYPSAEKHENGKLTLSETYNIEMNPELLTLSSCESGIGELIKGEGMLSFTRGFSYSGAKNVIFSLWKVNDRFTNDTMIELYRSIFSNIEFAESLRNAKLKLLASNKTLSPKDWAGFIIIEN